ncbi:MAG: response regulator receiver modulated metal dependent phosphohydrolase [Firmicutes bacterium]|nr:response regulator receiver modulated metal dependent phosphohydrolase [Bacillota bacterium]
MEQVEKQIILVVDDIPTNIDVLSEILRPTYQVKVATNGTMALKIAMAPHPPDLILLDIMMPGMSGYEVCQQLKDNLATRNIPVIFVTAMDEVENEAKGFELGAVDYIAKPVSPLIVLARVKTHLALLDHNRLLEKKVMERTAEIHDTRRRIIHCLGAASEYRDEETGNHIFRISHYSRIIALVAGLDKEEADLLLQASPMHDVGKIGIPDRILLKAGKLDKDEWEVMKTHTTVGAKIIGEHPSDLLKMARQVALTHHEKWDGTGYPYGLAGEDIPLASRIVMLADVFDALTSDRPYKKAWSEAAAIEEIKNTSGRHFDPKLVLAFIKGLPEILEVKRGTETATFGG